MDHRLVHGIEQAFGWTGPDPLGHEVAIGTLPEPDLCRRLLTPAGLLDLIAHRSLQHAQLRVLQDGTDLHPRDYLTQHASSRGHRISMANMPAIGRLLEHGATLVFDDLAPLDPTLEIACRALSWWSGEHARVNTYLTTQDASGWGLHWDSHDVLVVQLAGAKSWEVRGPSRIAPTDRDAVPNLEPADEIVWTGTLTAGQVLHIPRGWWHQATRNGAGAGHSLHATFGLTQPTGLDYLTWITDRARADVRFRRDLGQHPGPDRHHELADAAAELLATHSPAEFLTARRREDIPARHTTTFGLFDRVRAVVCVTGFPPEIAVEGDLVTVTAAGKKITMPAAALAVLQELLSGHPVDLADLADLASAVATGIAGAEVTTVAAALVRAGLCAELTPALEAGYRDVIAGVAAARAGIALTG